MGTIIKPYPLFYRFIEEIGLKHLEHNVTMVLVPVLRALLLDQSPTVVRHAISASSNLFANIFFEVAKQVWETSSGAETHFKLLLKFTLIPRNNVIRASMLDMWKNISRSLGIL